MARLFNLALEEVIEEAEVVAPVEPQEEIEAIENAESAGATEAEIENGVGEVEQALEEADKLQEQIKVNEEILGEPVAPVTDEGKGEVTPEVPAPEAGTTEPVADAAASAVDGEVSGEVTEAQVQEANESLKYALAFLGSPELFVKQVRVANENAKTLSLRDQLKVANEDAKEVLVKIIETAKRLIAQFVAKAVVWVKQIMLKFGNYGKAIDTATAALQGLNVAEIDAAKVKEALAKVGSAEVNIAVLSGSAWNYALATAGVAGAGLKATLNAVAAGKNPVEAKTEKQEIDVTKYGFKAVEGVVVGITGKSALVLSEKGYKKVALEATDAVEKATLNVNGLYNSVLKRAVDAKKAITDANNNIKAIQNVQSTCQAELNKLKSANAENKDKVAGQVEVAKSVAIVASMFRINEYLGAIKGFTKVAQALATKGKAEEKKEEAKAEEAK